ncbi:hypothetical protein [Enterococcus mundtii]|uniref:Uncharacterized protein n=1 Tax=Enterococcus mundtii TaxID=53346 RepID=A0A2S7RUG0_ENTMU|nr:hypothetical protein [Enterococcus mundtii]MBO1087044.1 hypothetical protein [Enterococcus mundtii]PQF23385.1 hypothetical protein CUS89_07400 [Enterococcus mundtii]
MRNYTTIYGEKIRGTVYVERTNVLIVKDEKGGMNVVRKAKITKVNKRVNNTGFDDKQVRQRGRTR